MVHCISHIQVIEFQKRGLPRSHILIRLSNDDIPKVDEFEKFVCAEIPNPVTHPHLHAIVTRNMLYGICDQRCLTPNNIFIKHFPKEPNEITRQPEVEYPVYRRCCRHDHVKTNKKGKLYPRKRIYRWLPTTYTSLLYLTVTLISKWCLQFLLLSIFISTFTRDHIGPLFEWKKCMSTQIKR